MMNHFLSRFGPLLLAGFTGASALVLAYHRSKKRVSSRSESRAPLDYLLLWPLLFKASSSVDRFERLLTNREIIGWLIVAALIVVGMVFF